MSRALPSRAPIDRDCVEIALAAEIGADNVAAVLSELDAALAERRHVLINAGGCRYLDPTALGAITKARQSFAAAGLDLLAFGGSGPVRYLLDAALSEPAEADPDRKSVRLRPFLRPAPEVP